MTSYNLPLCRSRERAHNQTHGPVFLLRHGEPYCVWLPAKQVFVFGWEIPGLAITYTVHRDYGH